MYLNSRDIFMKIARSTGSIYVTVSGSDVSDFSFNETGYGVNPFPLKDLS